MQLRLFLCAALLLGVASSADARRDYHPAPRRYRPYQAQHGHRSRDVAASAPDAKRRDRRGRKRPRSTVGSCTDPVVSGPDGEVPDTTPEEGDGGGPGASSEEEGDDGGPDASTEEEDDEPGASFDEGDEDEPKPSSEEEEQPSVSPEEEPNVTPEDEPDASSEEEPDASPEEEEPDASPEDTAAASQIFLEDLVFVETNNSVGPDVIACTSDALLLTASVPNGSIVISSVAAAASASSSEFEDCSSCLSLFHFAENVERGSALSGVSCPNGAQCWLVRTRRPIISEVVRPSILSTLPSGLRSKPVGFQPQCNQSKSATSGRQLLLTDGSDEDTDSSFIFVPRLPADRFYDNCSATDGQAWKKAPGSGCPFSFRCSNQPEKPCVYCNQDGRSCDNGCGAANSSLVFKELRLLGSPRRTVSFADACCGHDYCWSTIAFSQSACDLAFLRSLIRNCMRDLEPWNTNPDLTLRLQRLDCYVAASAMHTAVFWAGRFGVHGGAQKEQEEYLNTCKGKPENITGSWASVYTDPHLTSFDGLHFDCQASGEFTLAKSDSTGLSVQGRFSGPGTKGSVLKGIALQDSNSSRVQVSVAAANTSTTTVRMVNGCPLRVYLNGTEDTSSALLIPSADGQAAVDFSSIPVKIALQSGVKVQFKAARSSYFGCFMESLAVFVPAPSSSDVTGLLGSPNGNVEDDRQTPSGEDLPLPANSSELYFAGAYSYCTMNWCIRESADSIFSYDAGTSHAFYNFCDREYKDPPDLTAASAELKELCGDDVQCLVDGLVSGSLADAQSGLDA